MPIFVHSYPLPPQSLTPSTHLKMQQYNMTQLQKDRDIYLKENVFI